MKIQRSLGIAIITSVVVSTVLTSAESRRMIDNNKGMSESITFGVITRVTNPEKDFKRIKDLGFSYCQLNISTYSPELANQIPQSSEKYKVYPTALICMGPGKYAFRSFTEGPSTIGLIPWEFRESRIKRLHEGIDFCQEAGIPAVHAHFGYIPENPKDSLYLEFIRRTYYPT